MMQVRIYGRFRSLFKNPNLELPNDENIKSLKDLLLIVKENYSEGFYKEIVDERSNSLNVGVILTVNGKSISTEEGLETKLRDGDEDFIDKIGFIPLEGG